MDCVRLCGYCQVTLQTEQELRWAVTRYICKLLTVAVDVYVCVCGLALICFSQNALVNLLNDQKIHQQVSKLHTQIRKTEFNALIFFLVGICVCVRAHLCECVSLDPG